MQAVPDNNNIPGTKPTASLGQHADQHPQPGAPDLRIIGRQSSPHSRQSDSAAAQPDLRERLIKRQAVALQLVAAFLDQQSLQAGLTALVGELQHCLRCDRVAVGLQENTTLDVVAISQQANPDPQSGEIHLLRDAMLEACLQDDVIVYPGSDETQHMAAAHRELQGKSTQIWLCTVPLCYHGEIIGALLFERTCGPAGTDQLVLLMRQLAQLSASLIALRRDSERRLPSLLKQQAWRTLATILGPKQLLPKSVALICTLLICIAGFLPVTHRITADAELAPIQRRMITAPMVGYIDSVLVGTGDLVKSGQILLQLDTRDLELQKTRWKNQLLGTRAEFRSAMAGHDRKDMAVAQAQIEQAHAQIALVQQQIDRAELRAPTDGVVVSGDLSQSIGAPVERGSLLLELAPANGYKVQMLVDETDIGHIALAQRGRLALKSNPGSL